MTHLTQREMRGGCGGQRGGNWIQDGFNKFIDLNAGWMKRAVDRGARLRTQQRGGGFSLYRYFRKHPSFPQRGGRVPTLHERYCRRVLHGSKLKKKKRTMGVAAPRRKRKKRTGRVAPAVTAPKTTITPSRPMLRSPVVTRSRRRGIM